MVQLEIVRIDFAEHGAIIGAQSPDGFHFVVKGLIASGLLQGDHLLEARSSRRMSLLHSPAGSNSRNYGAVRQAVARHSWPWTTEIRFNRLVNDHFRAAVAQTGFDRRRTR